MIPSGNKLSLEIPVQDVLERWAVIHKLVARKILQALEESTGYIDRQECGVDRVKPRDG
jgi:hypothetical protein